jgi:hypothetical protein
MSDTIVIVKKGITHVEYKAFLLNSTKHSSWASDKKETIPNIMHYTSHFVFTMPWIAQNIVKTDMKIDKIYKNQKWYTFEQYQQEFPEDFL